MTEPAYYGLMPDPEVLLTYASILEKPKYYIHNGMKFQYPDSEIVKTAIMALRLCARRIAKAEEMEAITRGYADEER